MGTMTMSDSSTNSASTWFLVLILSISTITIFNFLFKLKQSITSKKKLPPGPFALPLVGNLMFLRKSSSTKLDVLIQKLHRKYGPIMTLHMGSRPVIFISTPSLIQQALLGPNGITFANRPPPRSTSKVLYPNQTTIFSSSYGPDWTLLRRNLVSGILTSSRLKSYSGARKWALECLIKDLKAQSQSGGHVHFIEPFRQSLMGLSIFMCFGLKLEDDRMMAQFADLFNRLLLHFARQGKLDLFPSKLSQIVFPDLWKQAFQLRKEKEDALIPLIRARIKQKEKEKKTHEESDPITYLDTLADLNLPEQNRKLEEGEIVSLCSEFITGIVYTTVVAAQWIMNDLAKHPEIQEKLYSEINGVLQQQRHHSESEQEFLVTEDDVKTMPYLKAVIMESLRKHPQGDFLLPHSVAEEVNLGGYVIPKNSVVTFMIYNLGSDENIWEDAMEFKPERFLDNENGDQGFDIRGGGGEGGIKLIPFGAGRRICPGLEVGLLHLQYFVANLVSLFKWSTIDDEVDMSGKIEISLAMKDQLLFRISDRQS